MNESEFLKEHIYKSEKILRDKFIHLCFVGIFLLFDIFIQTRMKLTPLYLYRKILDGHLKVKDEYY